MQAEGMAALAGWPVLGQLRRLVLSNASSQAVPNLEALADSPHVGPLLRVDIHNGHVPREAVPAVRRRFGGPLRRGGADVAAHDLPGRLAPAGRRRRRLT
jgi:hypothetical protein